MSHDHAHDQTEMAVSPGVRHTLMWIVLPLIVATIIGMIVLWPRGEKAASDEIIRVRGQIESAQPACPPGTPALEGGSCGTAVVRVGDETVTATVPSGASAPKFSVGDKVVMSTTDGQLYAVTDHDRRTILFLLVAAFAAMIIAFARWRGVMSLVGLTVSFAVLLWFILPAIQEGQAPLPVAIVGAAAIMFTVIYLTHGVNVGTTVAVLGTLIALILTGLLGVGVTHALKLTGSGTDEAAILSNVLTGVDLRGLLLAGIIIGTLGVLDDVTITQVSIVNELRLASPTATSRQLYRSALKVGRAHVASVVNTIILAYAGASLPLMLLLVTAGTKMSEVVTMPVLTTEIVRGAVGTLGLIAAVPITTFLAAFIARGRPPTTVH